MAEVTSLLRRDRQRPQDGRRDLGGRGERGIRCDVDRGRDVERADARAAQRRQMTADTEIRTEIAGERTDVRAARAVDDDVEVDPLGDGAHARHREPADRDLARLEFHLLARASEVVGPLAAHLDGRHRAGHLLNPTRERGDTCRNGVGCDCSENGGIRPRDLRAVGVVGVGRRAQTDRGLVGLVEPHDERQQARRRAHPEDQEPRRHRVERAGVADLARVQRTPGAGDDVVARDAVGFVDQQNAVRGAVGVRLRHPPSLSGASSRARRGVLGPT